MIATARDMEELSTMAGAGRDDFHRALR